MRRKGFPESYKTRRLLEFVASVKAGEGQVSAPLYSHLVYDIVPDQCQIVDRPDVLILEGLNVLQGAEQRHIRAGSMFVSDFFDFSIYVDADEANLETWFLNRFTSLRDTAFRDPDSYFKFYAEMPEAEALDRARGIWRDINLANLRENIAPTRDRASIVLRKGERHAVEEVWLRKL